MKSRFEDLNGAVIAAVRDGLTLDDAATHAGVSVNTVRGWFREGGKNPEGRFGVFAADVKAARESVPDGPMDLDELRAVIAHAARKGSTQAMKLALELLRVDDPGASKPSDPFSDLDELAAARRTRGRGAA